MRLIPLVLLALPWAAHAETIYLCKAYSGGMFWSSVTCSQKQATVDRMLSVPDGLPWDQKVALGEAARAQAQATAEPQFAQPTPLPQIARQNECAQLRTAIDQVNKQIALRRPWHDKESQNQFLEQLEERRKKWQC